MIITISRQAATNGSLIGRLVAERLHVPIFDRELVDEVARRLQVDPSVVIHFDEVALGTVSSLLWEWRASLNETIYQRYLSGALHRIATAGSAVVIGRGANFILRCPDCLNVRLIAPLALRVAIYQATNPVTVHEAEKAIHAEDHEKANFIRALYHAEIGAPEHYDMVLNLGGLTPEMAADLIAQAAQARQAALLRPEAEATLPAHLRQMLRHHHPPTMESVPLLF